LSFRLQGIAGIAKVLRDVWFVGYTPELTAAVWMGYEKTDRSTSTISGFRARCFFPEVLAGLA
jgi:penicillin-binding protein 2A